jgi:hypothetical protein
MLETSVTSTVTTPRVRQIEVPREAGALTTLSRVDYRDAFLVDVGRVAERTAEQWTRAVVEGAPADVRCTLQSGWAALGLQLDAAASDRLVLGWPIRDSTREFVLLGARSDIGMEGELLFMRKQHDLLFATFIRLDSDRARATWSEIEPAHAPIVRRILEDASRRCRP